MRRRTGRPLIAVVLVLAVLGTASVASAASVAVDAGALDTFAVGNPCDGTLAATTPTTTGSASTVEVTPPAACVDRTIAVAVSDGTVVRQGTATAPASGSVTVTLDGAYTPSTTTQIAATASGWHLDTTWDYTPPVDPPPAAGPVVPGTPYTDIRSLTWPTLAGGNQACFAITVSTTNANGNRDWAVDLDTESRPFNGATTGYQIGGADGSRVELASSTPVNGVLTIVGIAPDHKLRSSQSLSFTVCNYSTPQPTYDPTLTYSVTTSAPSSEWNPCLTVTVGVVGTPLFYAGWRADVDMTPAIDAITAAGGTYAGTVEVRTGDIQIQQMSPTVWRATPTGWGTVGIRDGEVQVVTMCAVRQ